MAQFKGKADAAFDNSLEVALLDRDFKKVEKIFSQYGAYLELIGGDAPSEKSLVLTASSYSDTVRIIEGSF